MIEVRLVRLAGKTEGGAYHAQVSVYRDTVRYVPVDYIDVIAMFDGAARDVVTSHSHRRAHRFVPGEIVVYRPGDEILLAGSPPHGVDFGFVSFPQGAWYDLSALAGIDQSWMSAPEPPIVHFDPASPVVRRIFEAAAARPTDSTTMLDLIRFWIDIVPHLFTEPPRTSRKNVPAWLARGLDEMAAEENLRRGLPRLLELTHVSPSHLALSTRAHFGRTPSEVVSDLRLRHAAALLSSTATAIAEIGERCGFSSPAYFSTAFRRRYLSSPREYRARSRRGPVLVPAPTFDSLD